MRNPHLWLFLLVYAASLATLAALGQPLEDALSLLVLLGVLFPGLAWVGSLRTPPPSPADPARPGEAWLLAGLVAYLCAFLAFKGPLLAGLEPDDADPRLHEVLNTALKLAAFVALPLLIWRARYGALPSAGRSGMSPARQLRAFVLIGGAIFATMFLISRGTKVLFGPEFTTYQRVAGLLLSFAWMSLSAGVVEEVFFRWLLQSRIAAITGSQLSGIFLATLAFGLAHAPGMWLRGAGVSEGLGEDPSLTLALAYSVTTQGLAGLMFAVLWARTRSLPLVIALHGLIDASSNAAEFIRTWHL